MQNPDCRPAASGFGICHQGEASSAGEKRPAEWRSLPFWQIESAASGKDEIEKGREEGKKTNVQLVCSSGNNGKRGGNLSSMQKAGTSGNPSGMLYPQRGADAPV